MSDAAPWELVVDAHDQIGEGPSWDVGDHSLLWVDIAGQKVWRLDPADGSTWQRAFDQMVGAVLPRAAGGLALCLQDGVWLTDTDEGPLRRLVAIEADDPRTRLNDVKVDRAGRLWGGTMAMDAEPDAGAFYRVGADGSLAVISSPTTISNGIDWSPDEGLMYYIDSATHRVDVFDFDPVSGIALDRRPFIRLEESAGLPDGMTVDAEGYLWVAFYDGWAVRRYTPAGALDRIIRLPAARITSCAFGGPNLSDLYVTSATAGLAEAQLAEQPHAGGLFVVRPGVAGLPSTPFAG
jgi:sugar lactone lactonase YvrE